MNRRSLFKRMFGALTAGATAFCLGDVETQVSLPDEIVPSLENKDEVWCVTFVAGEDEIYKWDPETDKFIEFTESKYD